MIHSRRTSYRIGRARLNSQFPRLLPGAVRRLPVDDGIAVTIDDGPTETGTLGIVRHCAVLGLKATFFFSGSQVKRFPETMQEVAAAGHDIASHGWRHVSPLRLRGPEFLRDLTSSINVIEEVSGRRPRCYRPPYGRIHPVHLRRAAALGCTVVLWSLMPGDWYPDESVADVRRRLECLRGGDIVVLHERPGQQNRMLDVLSSIAELCDRRGLSFHTLESVT